MIKHNIRADTYTVWNESQSRSFGTYQTLEEAQIRLEQVESFKSDRMNTLAGKATKRGPGRPKGSRNKSKRS